MVDVTPEGGRLPLASVANQQAVAPLPSTIEVVFGTCPAAGVLQVPFAPGTPCGITGFPSWVLGRLYPLDPAYATVMAMFHGNCCSIPRLYWYIRACFMYQSVGRG